MACKRYSILILLQKIQEDIGLARKFMMEDAEAQPVVPCDPIAGLLTKLLYVP